MDCAINLCKYGRKQSEYTYRKMPNANIIYSYIRKRLDDVYMFISTEKPIKLEPYMYILVYAGIPRGDHDTRETFNSAQVARSRLCERHLMVIQLWVYNSHTQPPCRHNIQHDTGTACCHRTNTCGLELDGSVL